MNSAYKYLVLNQVEQNLAQEIKDPIKKLGFCVLLKHMEHRGYFPRNLKDVPLSVITNIADQLEINGKLLRQYKLNGRTSKRHKQEIKDFLGFRNPKKEDRLNVQSWLCSKLSIENDLREFLATAQQRFLDLKICVPSDKVLNEVASSALAKVEDSFFNTIFNKIPRSVKNKIDNLISGKVELGLSDLKKDPGRIGLKSLKKESKKLESLQDLNFPKDLFLDISKKHLL